MVRALLGRLERAYGPQRWWPADDAFEVIVGAVLVQRTTWQNAAAAIAELRTKGLLSCNALATARLDTLRACVHRAGFYRTKAVRLRAISCHIRERGGLAALARCSTPALRTELLGLPGIGAETADAIVLYAFQRPVWVSDAYSRRLFARMSGAEWSRTDELVYIEPLVRQGNVGALQELHALIVEHGKRRCKTQPDCRHCVLRRHCALARQSMHNGGAPPGGEAVA